MRILFLTHVLPFPLDAGPKIRAHYVLRQLIESGHDVTVCSYQRQSDTGAAIAELRSLASDLILVPLHRSRLRDVLLGTRSLLRSSSFTIDRDRVPAMARRLARLAGAEVPFDAVHADQLAMAPEALALRARGACRFVVLDQHNAVFRIVERLRDTARLRVTRPLLAAEATKLQRRERGMCSSCDRVVWVSEADRHAVLGDASAEGHSTVIPIALDTAGETRPTARDNSPPLGRIPRVTFLGGLHWPPNRDGVSRLVRRIWPRVRDAAPDARLTIIGRDPPRWLRARGDGDARMDILGHVEDPTPLLRETRAFVVPLDSGAGMRVKILEAWRSRLPVVSTTLGAEGIRAVDGENMLLADDDDAFARAVLSLLEDAGAAERLGAGGRAALEQYYDWRTAYVAWSALYEELDREQRSEGRV